MEYFKSCVLATFDKYMEDIGVIGESHLEHRVDVNGLYDVLCFEYNIVDGIEYKNPRGVPFVYIRDIYNSYADTLCEEEIMEFFASVMKDYILNDIRCENSIDFSKDTGRIVMQLVNTDLNLSLLRTIPHRQWYDLSIVYRVVATEEVGMNCSYLITNADVERAGITEDTLYAYAKENMERILPAAVCGVAEIFDVDEASKVGLEENAFQVSHVDYLWGAACIFQEGVLEKLASDMGEDLYLVPLSVHEFMVQPVSSVEPQNIRICLSDVDSGDIDVADFLSTHVYLYEKETGVISPVFG